MTHEFSAHAQGADSSHPRAARSAVWLLGAWTVAGALATVGLPATAADGARNVLVLHAHSRLLPADVEASDAIRQTVATSASRKVELYDEFLDMPRFSGQAYEDTIATFLRKKYANRPPAVIVVAGEEALRFLLQNRPHLFPDVPVVHIAVSRDFLRSIAPVPSDVVGVPIEIDFSATVEQALRWHPKTRRLVIVTGASRWDRDWERRVREEGARFQDRVAIEVLAGLPTGAVQKRLAELSGDAVVFTPGYFEDGDHRVFLPRESIAAMSAASHAPIYGPFSTHLGQGIVGGYSWRFADAGSQAGRIVNDLLGGAAPSALRLPEVTPAALNVDWRQMKRWGIDESAIPAGAVVHFRVPTFLEEHRMVVLIAAAALLLQAALIARLLVERYRRRLVERAAQKQAYELAHASRVALAGELTAAIAHEINQPLGAILANAETADLLLDSGLDRRDKLREIHADIRRDDLRASEVIRRLRGLLTKQEVERRPFDFNEALRDVESILGGEAERRGATIVVQPSTTVATIVGDRVQVQQVLMNLLLNAMDAVAGLPEDRRTIVVSAETIQGRVAVAVRDKGRGVPSEHLPKLFDSFFTTKTTGMGLGLSIAHSVVRAHGGRIWADSNPGEGTVFYLDLPMTNEKGSSSPEPA